MFAVKIFNISEADRTITRHRLFAY
jgi:hypothetical protein